MTIADALNTGLLVAAVVGIGLTFWQVRSGVRTQRAQFLKDLYSTLAADPDVLAAYYQIEYGNFQYDVNFHGSAIEPKIDRLLAFTDLVAELYLQSVISEREMAFFRYRFRRIYEDVGIQEYLKFLSSFYQRVGVNKEPYHSFQHVARRLAIET